LRGADVQIVDIDPIPRNGEALLGKLPCANTAGRYDQASGFDLRREIENLN
jgi:hypothetical protein